MIRFYSKDILSTNKLSETESGHCIRVLRMSAGDIIHVVDGNGNSFECSIKTPNPKGVEVDILSVTKEEKHWNPYLTLAVAPTKNIDRIEWMLEKCVEIGVDRIVLLRCKRSERKEVKNERLEKILVSAMKQSMKSKMPVFDGMIPINEFLENVDSDSMKFMGYCNQEFPLKFLLNEYVPQKNATIMIGPEGDFTPEEVQLSVSAGFIPVSFGDTRLRTETAALYSLSAIHAANQLYNFKK